MHQGWLLVKRLLPLAGSAALLCVLAGCGGPRTYPVEGKVTFPDGTPLKGALVTLAPKGEDAPPIGARGETDEQGVFRLSTYKLDDGAPEGTYRVAVAPPMHPDPEKPPPQLIDPRFSDYESSGVEFTVSATQRNVLPITVTLPRPGNQ